jgi:hypothetical protein
MNIMTVTESTIPQNKKKLLLLASKVRNMYLGGGGIWDDIEQNTTL